MNKDFVSLFVTMIIGGLTYSIISFSYMHSTFTTKDQVDKQDSRIDRIQKRTDDRLKSIEEKIDYLIKAGK